MLLILGVKPVLADSIFSRHQAEFILKSWVWLVQKGIALICLVMAMNSPILLQQNAQTDRLVNLPKTLAFPVRRENQCPLGPPVAFSNSSVSENPYTTGINHPRRGQCCSVKVNRHAKAIMLKRLCVFCSWDEIEINNSGSKRQVVLTYSKCGHPGICISEFSGYLNGFSFQGKWELSVIMLDLKIK